MSLPAQPAPSGSRYDWMRQAALAAAFVWACWITANGLATGLRQGMGPGEVLLHTAFPGLLFLAGVFAAWRWPSIGGVLLMLEGAASFLFYPYYVALPPILSGIVLLAWRIRQG